MFEIVVKPYGDLVDFNGWDQFAESMSQIVLSAPDKITLDMISVTRISSNYIGTVISSSKAAEEKGKKIRIINVQPKLYDLLDMLKLTTIMSIERFRQE